MTNKTATKKTEKVQKPEPYLQPDYDTVIMDEILPDRITAGGIYIPDTVSIEDEDGLRSGYIISVGPASNPDRPFLFNVGDVVSFGHYAGRTIKLKNKEYVVVRHLDLLFRTVNA